MKPASEVVEKFHNCLRSNCSEHETYEDCEKALAQALIDFANDGLCEKSFKAGRAEALEEASAKHADVMAKNVLFARNEGLKEAIAVVNAKKCGHQMDIEEKIRALISPGS